MGAVRRLSVRSKLLLISMASSVPALMLAGVVLVVYQGLERRPLPYAGITVVAIALGAAVAFVLSSRLQRIVSEPIRRLAGAVTAVSREGDHSIRTPKTSEDELGGLVDGFNGMLGTIEKQNLDLKAANDRLAGLAEELEAKNIELERFTYTVSHDLKSPLITIKGFLGLLEKDAAAGDTKRMRRDAERIHAAADKMARLLAELLEVSRIGRMMNPPQEATMGELAAEAVEQADGVLSARGVRVEIAADLPAVRGDRPRLVEVIHKLVENAAKFMGDQQAPRIEIGLDRERTTPGAAAFLVRDNGIGIDPKHHEKVFGLFERLGTDTEGTGIGLAIVKRIVEVHGGRIWVESEGEGLGSTFFFTLPVARGSGAAGAGAETTPTREAPGRVPGR